MAEGKHQPPKDVQKVGQRAVEWIEDNKQGDGFTEVGEHRAHQLADGEKLSDEDVQKMQAYFARHKVDKEAEGFEEGSDGYPSPGRVAWDAWGGDEGKKWVDGIDLDDD